MFLVKLYFFIKCCFFFKKKLVSCFYSMKLFQCRWLLWNLISVRWSVSRFLVILQNSKFLMEAVHPSNLH